MTNIYKHEKDLLNYISTIIPTYLAKDIIQNTYLKIIDLEKQKKLYDKNIKSLLFTIAKNEALQELRNINRTNSQTIIDNMILVSHDDIEMNDDVVDFLKYMNSSDDVNIKMIKDQSYGMTLKQLSDKYNLSVSAVKSRLFYTKKKLRKKYEV